jgi:uncharacterized membrane protein
MDPATPPPSTALAPGPSVSGPSWLREAATAAGPPTPEDCQNAFYAHVFASIANVLSAGVLLPLLGAAIPLFLDQRRHPFLLFHINQSFWYQLLLAGVNLVLVLAVTAVAMITCGFGAVLYVVCVIPPLVGIIHPLFVGMKVREGAWTAYPVVGERVLRATTKPLIG